MKKKEQILKKLKEIIESELYMAGEELNYVEMDTPVTCLKNFHADSLDEVEIILRIEDDFGIEISDSLAESWGYKTMRDVVDWIYNEVAEEDDSDDDTNEVCDPNNHQVNIDTVYIVKDTTNPTDQNIIGVASSHDKAKDIVKKYKMVNPLCKCTGMVMYKLDHLTGFDSIDLDLIKES